MVPEADAPLAQPTEFKPRVLSAETSPFATLKKQVRASVFPSGALNQEVCIGGATGSEVSVKSPVVARGKWDIGEPEVIVIEDFENEVSIPFSSAGLRMGSPGHELGNGVKGFDSAVGDGMSRCCRGEDLQGTRAVDVEGLSALPMIAPYETLLKVTASDGGVSLGADCDTREVEGRIQRMPTLAEPLLVESLGGPGIQISCVVSKALEGFPGALGRTAMERLQRGDDDLSSGTSGIGTPSSEESESELEAGLPVEAGPFYQVSSACANSVAVSIIAPNPRRLSAPAVPHGAASSQLREEVYYVEAASGIGFADVSSSGAAVASLVLDERIGSGGSASSSAEEPGRWLPQRLRKTSLRPECLKTGDGRSERVRTIDGRPPRPSSAQVTRTQSLRGFGESSGLGQSSPNPESFGGPEENLRDRSLSPDPPASSPTPSSYLPFIRSGAASAIGSRPQMEDAHLTIDDISERLEGSLQPAAFFGVFDGHGGRDAADYAEKHLLDNLLGETTFPGDVRKALVRSFLETDQAFHRACLDEKVEHSGTTALTALVFGRTLVVANAGDCRAVLSQKGRMVEMSRDQKPECETERQRIVAKGGYVEDGYLNGQLGVARALGNWHMEDIKARGQLTAEPEVKIRELEHDDEFLILGCDGLWDVMSSYTAVDFARKRLRQHNDPMRCSQELVEEALRRQTSDNVTVVTVCFQRDPPERLSTAAPAGVRRSISVDSLRVLQGAVDTCD